MGRFVFVSALTGALVVAMVGSSAAFQCPKLVQAINNEAGNRLDDAGYQARQMAEDAEKLHKEGKHAESEAKAKEAMKLLGI